MGAILSSSGLHLETTHGHWLTLNTSAWSPHHCAGQQSLWSSHTPGPVEASTTSKHFQSRRKDLPGHSLLVLPR